MNESELAESRFAEGLTSQHLRRIREVFPEVRSPERAVASSAIVRAAKIVLARTSEALRPFDLVATHFEILSMLYRSPEGQLSMKDLGRLTMQNPASMTYAVGTLEKRNLLLRRTDPANRRSVIVELTAAGRTLVVEAVVHLEQVDWGLHDLRTEAAVQATLNLCEIEQL